MTSTTPTPKQARAFDRALKALLKAPEGRELLYPGERTATDGRVLFSRPDLSQTQRGNAETAPLGDWRKTLSAPARSVTFPSAETLAAAVAIVDSAIEVWLEVDEFVGVRADRPDTYAVRLGAEVEDGKPIRFALDQTLLLETLSAFVGPVRLTFSASAFSPILFEGAAGSAVLVPRRGGEGPTRALREVLIDLEDVTRECEKLEAERLDRVALGGWLASRRCSAYPIVAISGRRAPEGFRHVAGGDFALRVPASVGRHSARREWVRRAIKAFRAAGWLAYYGGPVDASLEAYGDVRRYIGD